MQLTASHYYDQLTVQWQQQILHYLGAKCIGIYCTWKEHFISSKFSRLIIIPMCMRHQLPVHKCKPKVFYTVHWDGECFSAQYLHSVKDNFLRVSCHWWPRPEAKVGKATKVNFMFVQQSLCKHLHTPLSSIRTSKRRYQN